MLDQLDCSPNNPLATERLYFPLGHDTQSDSSSLPSVSTCVPGGQETQVVLLVAPTAVEYVPIWHSTQSVSLSLPGVSRYLPAPHAMHAVAPGEGEYVPAEQGVQAPSAALPSAVPYFPAPHPRHVALDAAPRTSENVPATHFKHVVDEFEP